jgi:hypothetical protein
VLGPAPNMPNIPSQKNTHMSDPKDVNDYFVLRSRGEDIPALSFG